MKQFLEEMIDHIVRLQTGAQCNMLLYDIAYTVIFKKNKLYHGKTGYQYIQRVVKGNANNDC